MKVLISKVSWTNITALPFEIWLTTGFALFAVLLSLILDFPMVIPGAGSATFVGMHYLYPLLGIALWALLVAVQRTQPLARTFLLALPCYAVVLLCHFNLKLWITHVNPVLWDNEYWQIDKALHPLVAGLMELRLSLSPVIPLDSNFYMFGFIIMFYLAFAYHARQSKDVFRELFVAVLLLQVLGSLFYFVAPALGPFLFEQGVEPPAAAAQSSMYESWMANRSGGAEWLAKNGATQFTTGLAAMPSLHAGGSLLFAIFAWRHGPRLLPVMLPLFLFIVVTAIANRWHYLIDIPFGMALAVVAASLAHRIVGASTTAPRLVAQANGDQKPVPAPAGSHLASSTRA